MPTYIPGFQNQSAFPPSYMPSGQPDWQAPMINGRVDIAAGGRGGNVYLPRTGGPSQADDARAQLSAAAQALGGGLGGSLGSNTGTIAAAGGGFSSRMPTMPTLGAPAVAPRGGTPLQGAPGIRTARDVYGDRFSPKAAPDRIGKLDMTRYQQGVPRGPAMSWNPTPATAPQFKIPDYAPRGALPAGLDDNDPMIQFLLKRFTQ